MIIGFLIAVLLIGALVGDLFISDVSCEAVYAVTDSEGHVR